MSKVTVFQRKLSVKGVVAERIVGPAGGFNGQTGQLATLLIGQRSRQRPPAAIFCVDGLAPGVKQKQFCLNDFRRVGGVLSDQRDSHKLELQRWGDPEARQGFRLKAEMKPNCSEACCYPCLKSTIINTLQQTTSVEFSVYIRFHHKSQQLEKMSITGRWRAQPGQGNGRVRISTLKRILGLSCLALLGLAEVGCNQKPAAPAAAGMQGMPVQTVAVTLSPVPQSSEYVATIKSRRAVTLMPQVSGLLTKILVRSGDHVKAGQPLMEIDPRQQLATVDSARATERQKKALYDYNVVEVERQLKLFEAGVTSHDVFDQAKQTYENTKADYESAVQLRKTQEDLLAYYTIRAPFEGVVGDIPVHVGDYASPSSSPATVLTTVDENKDLEAYIYVPTERGGEVRQGLAVDLTDTNGKLLEKTKIDFLSSEVDSTLQGILVKAPVHATPELLRNAQLVKARIIWSVKPMAVIPVLAVTRQGGQSFVFVAQEQNGHTFAIQMPVTLGDTVGNNYSISSGLNVGDKVIVSSTQFLVNHMPVMPMPGA